MKVPDQWRGVKYAIAALEARGPSRRDPETSGAGASMTLHTDPTSVSVYWYPPPTGNRPILGYRVQFSGRPVLTIKGLSDFLMASTWCRPADVFTGLSRRKTYQISIRALTPAGIGPPLSSGFFRTNSIPVMGWITHRDKHLA